MTGDRIAQNTGLPGNARATDSLDALIIGGGVAGLWLLNLLAARGYDVRLLEADQLGAGQTLGSQGMIHGGLKYALSGRLTGASEAIAAMPDRWRRCLAGQDDVDLSGLTPRSEHYYLFAEATSLGRLTGFFASRALRGRIDKLERPAFPPGLQRFDGVVYAMNDFVLDTPALLERLAAPVRDRIHRHAVSADQLERQGQEWRLALPAEPSGADGCIRSRCLILCAGAGNGALLSGLGIDEPAMQLRPLHQVAVRHPALSELYAHCLTGITRSEPRLTITSHPDPAGEGRWLWYLGGLLATSGVERTEQEQIAHALNELDRCVPWVNWADASLETSHWNRAEPLLPGKQGGQRPDEAFTASIDGCIVCWPTKLSLTPDLGDQVLARLGAPAGVAAPTPDLPPPSVGALPWESV